MRTIDIAGQKFGSLTALEKTQKGKKVGWRCRCDCGQEITIASHALRKGKHPSCGCKRRLDLVGRTFGYWKVLSQVPAGERPTKDTYFLCRCVCGEEKAVVGHRLVQGKSKSCRTCCFKYRTPSDHRKKGLGEALRNAVIRTYRRNAKLRDLDFTLCDEEVSALLGGDCAYCGAPPSRTLSDPAHHGDFVCNGIDRVENRIGYVPGNVVSCCARCNYGKHTCTYDEFIEWIARVARHLKVGLGAAA